jgi:hypothetical protein
MPFTHARCTTRTRIAPPSWVGSSRQQRLPSLQQVYDFTDSRAGKHAAAFLADWRGKLVCDDH